MLTKLIAVYLFLGMSKSISQTNIYCLSDSIPSLDQSLNNIFKIGSLIGIKEHVGIKEFNKIRKSYYNEIYISNSDKTQYAQLFVYFLGNAYIRKILVTYPEKEDEKKYMYKSKIKSFTTNRKIRLGIAEEEFEKISQDTKYKISNQNGYKVYEIYRVIDPKKEVSHLDNEYSCFYFFRDHKLMSFSFGYF